MVRIVGIDEVGRGSWAGPVVAGAVMLDRSIPNLKDSKALSKSQRTTLSKQIIERASAYGLGWVMATELDMVGLTEAVRLAMQRALSVIYQDYDAVIIDGNYNFLAADPRAVTFIKADSTVPAVSAASIIAKVARDNWMAAVSEEYPEYRFDLHVGYGTPLHRARLKHFGICSIHRQSYKPVQAIIARSDISH